MVYDWFRSIKRNLFLIPQCGELLRQFIHHAVLYVLEA